MSDALRDALQGIVAQWKHNATLLDDGINRWNLLACVEQVEKTLAEHPPDKCERELLERIADLQRRNDQQARDIVALQGTDARREEQGT